MLRSFLVAENLIRVIDNSPLEILNLLQDIVMEGFFDIFLKTFSNCLSNGCEVELLENFVFSGSTEIL